MSEMTVVAQSHLPDVFGGPYDWAKDEDGKLHLTKRPPAEETSDD